MNLRFGLSFLIVYFFALPTNSSHPFKFSVFSFWRQVAVFFKIMPSVTMSFFKVYCRRAIAKSGCIFGNCNHSKMLWIPAINSFTDMIYNFSFFKFTVNNHRKLMSSYIFSMIRNCSISISSSGPLPQPTRIGYAGFFFKLIQIKIIISWRFKNTFHLSPSTSI